MTRIFKVLKRAGLDGFLLAIILMVALAWVWRFPALYQGAITLDQVGAYGVSVIFFFYGLKLSPEKLKAGLRNGRLHALVHISTFILFPVIALCIRPLFPEADNLWLGIFYLAALPSTVSSSVVMVAIAKGNLPAAIFNASVSSLIGVFLTPLWMGLVLDVGTMGEYDFLAVMADLSLQVLLPVFAGIFLHRYLGAFADNNRKYLKYFDQSIILLIVYTAFAKSFEGKMFEGFSIIYLLSLAVGMVALFFAVYGIVHVCSRWMSFSREDRITAIFCGSKKSLVHGTVMAAVLFPSNPMVGVILLPIMMYHALQLIMVSAIAQGMAKRSAGE